VSSMPSQDVRTFQLGTPAALSTRAPDLYCQVHMWDPFVLSGAQAVRPFELDSI
jgi:hypothetical protein